MRDRMVLTQHVGEAQYIARAGAGDDVQAPTFLPHQDGPVAGLVRIVPEHEPA